MFVLTKSLFLEVQLTTKICVSHIESRCILYEVHINSSRAGRISMSQER
jgi:hypothetical protein